MNSFRMNGLRMSPWLGTLLAKAAFGLALIVSLGALPAQAQFVCDSDAAGESGAGATAAGSANNVACGTNADASGAGSANTAIGDNVNASSGFFPGFNTAIGAAANASGGGGSNTATGRGANASGFLGNNTATGALANASGDGSSNIANGIQANASGGLSANIASGFQANASGDLSANIASGFFANASGNASSNTASGNGADASGAGSGNIAIGSDARATGNGTANTAVGAGSRAQFTNSAAFGNGATATRANQQMFGTAGNTYTLAGIASAASSAAQTGPTRLVTSDASGNLATTSLSALGLATTADIAGINSRLDDLTSRSSKAYAGIAMAFAMSGAPTVLPNETFVTTVNWGTFLGSHALAVGSAYRLSNNVQLNGGIAMSPDQNLVSGRAGVRFSW